MAKTILVVDDDADVRALLGEFLARHGFEVHLARDGRHALLSILVGRICDGLHRVHAPVRGARRMSHASMSG